MNGRAHRLFIIAAVVLALSSATIDAGEGAVGRLEPDHPLEGGTITITYDAGAPKAQLGVDEDIYVLMPYASTDHGYHRVTAKMRRGGGKVFTHTQAVPAGAAMLTVYFSTLSASDDSGISTMIYRADGVPVRTAWEQRMLLRRPQDDTLDLFAREMALYPDNLAAYRNKWFVAMMDDRETVRSTIEKDMRRVERKMRGDPLDGLYALCYGHAQLGHEAEARSLLRKMMALYPAAPLTATALGDYEYQAYAQRWPSEGRDEVAAMVRRILVAYPNSDTARKRMITFSHDVTLPLDAVETIADDWMKEEPENPVPAYQLAKVYESRSVKMDQAAALVQRAVDGMLRGLLRPYGSGPLTGFYVPDACLTAARIEMKLDHPALALGYAKTAQSLEKETEPDAWLLEGNVWDAVRSPQSAEVAYLEAYRRGSKEAEEALRTAYHKSHGSLDGFEARLGELAARPRASSTTRKPAPDFKVTSADGTEFDSATLRGKVMVLNFWGTGCGPCKAEIPDLNRLVEKYRNSDVVFLALTMEGDHDLAPFLAEHPFVYRVIPRAWMAFESYGVDSLPVHVVVGRQGDIVARLTGAGEERAEQLGRLIDQALAQPFESAGAP
jgi:thiol-disulfide isomerase/thioredoxin